MIATLTAGMRPMLPGGKAVCEGFNVKGAGQGIDWSVGKPHELTNSPPSPE